MASSWSYAERRVARRAAWGRRAAAALAAATACLASGCVQMYLKRDPLPTEPPPPAVPSPLQRTTGSLWRDEVSANYLFADVKARFAGDLLTIVITEDADGSKEAETSTSTESEVFANFEQFFGFPQALQENNPSIDPTQLIKASTARTFDGEGSTNRKGRLKARMTAVVKAVSPNGNLWVQGDKIVSVNKEDQHIVVQGWVRPEDIDSQNQVLSTRLADARVDYYGVGTLGVKQSPGWGYWLLDVVWPF
ncbi:MAG: flagellar basal body L-ring protein FlgH [Deltaproteobacteria bacterium]|nr:flagellar basal body L-ring protein FlgH [Deltaproteobacteria bacterium]